MKSYNGLFDAMLEIDEIEVSIDEAAKRKTNRRLVKKILSEKHERAIEIRNMLLNDEWHPKRHEVIYIQEGAHRKQRNIIKPTWYPEQIIHHMMARQIARIYGPRVYPYVAGTVKAPNQKKGRGALFCMRVMRRWRNEYGKKRFYVAELDITKFFDSIDTGILKQKLRKRIRDRRFMNLLEQIIDTAGPGIPKGYYLSPWLAQAYLMDIDNYIQQTLKPDHYMRFVDNFFLLHRNKKELHRMVEQLTEYIGHDGLQFNGSMQVYRFEKPDAENRIHGRAIDCLGFVIHHNRVTLRKRTLKRIRAKARRIDRNGHCTVHDASAMLSYKGWLSQTDTYNYFKRHIHPYISFRYCRYRVSKARHQKEAIA